MDLAIGQDDRLIPRAVAQKGASMPEIMTTADAARYCRCSRAHFWKLRLEFDVPTIRVGRGLRFRKIDLDLWMERCEQLAKKRDAAGGGAA